MPSILANANANLAGGQQYNKPAFIATGGTVTTFVSGGINYTSHIFTGSAASSLTDTFTVLGGATSAQLLVVAGGGSGGNSAAQFNPGSGGGAGGVLYSSSFDLSPWSGYPAQFNVFVGRGGRQGFDENGITSSFNPVNYDLRYNQIAFGGGAGNYASGSNGGSGGGGTAYSGSGVIGQGKDGGVGQLNTRGGGGGGAFSVGGSVVAGTRVDSIGGGGAGIQINITGSVSYFGGGGGGGWSGNPTGNPTGSVGGGGIGVFGSNGTAGSANTGGGGGGGWATADSSGARQGGAGGCGIVIVTYKTSGS